MSPELLLPLIGFALVTSITPGPNNMMLLASGANFGFRPTVPHMFGISVGHAIMVVLVGAGIAGLFDMWPVAETALKIICLGYLLYLAWKIATAAPPRGSEMQGRPMTFLQAAAFQWVNPKAWAMALSAVTVYAPNQSPGVIAVVAIVFASINLPSVSVWTVLGMSLRRFLSDARRLRAFNWTMAALLIGSVIPMI